ncbi:MAG TPA: MerR family transcriptional regulator [Dehalococcoidia bacterium]|nr:MerR family transcriptional regulator [Dehalococcoidia bacterium]
MHERLTIGGVARETGLPVRTIRFYEAEGIVPRPARTAAGYRLYSHTDVRRLRLARQVRALGLPLSEVKELVGLAFSSECGAYMDDLLARLAAQRQGARRQIDEWQALCTNLDELERHVRHLRDGAPPGRRVAECGCCPLIDEGAD